MSDARGRIVEIIKENVHDSVYGGVIGHYSAADAIVAALPDIVRGMVKPLVWEDVGLGRHIAGNYSIKDRMDYWGVYRDFVAINDEYQQPNEQAAKAAANAHNAAQVLGALGLK